MEDLPVGSGCLRFQERPGSQGRKLSVCLGIDHFNDIFYLLYHVVSEI
jgi:hypothetical protein